MTRDEFDTKYKLLKQIRHGDEASFTAQECASGRAVLVHFLPEDGPPPAAPVATLTDRLGPRDRSKILEILAVDRSTVVVTQFLEDFEGFDAWLQSRLAAPPLPAPEVPSPPPAGEFTQLFEPASAAPPAPSAAPPAPPAPPAAPLPSPAPTVAAAEEGSRGGFTELFRPPRESKTSPYPTPTPAAPVEILSVRIPLHEPAPPRPVVPMPGWPSSLEPPKAPPLPSPVLPAPRLRPRPGEPIVKAPARDPLPPPAPVPGWSGESDYTRQLRPVPAPGEPAPAVAAAEPVVEPAAGASRSIVPLLLVLNIVVIIATGVILYFALQRR